MDQITDITLEQRADALAAQLKAAEEELERYRKMGVSSDTIAQGEAHVKKLKAASGALAKELGSRGAWGKTSAVLKKTKDYSLFPEMGKRVKEAYVSLAGTGAYKKAMDFARLMENSQGKFKELEERSMQIPGKAYPLGSMEGLRGFEGSLTTALRGLDPGLPETSWEKLAASIYKKLMGGAYG